MEHAENYDFCRSYILKDEIILWMGKPEKGNLLAGQTLTSIPFGIVWLAFCCFWEFNVIRSGAPLFMALWGLPFIAIGIYLLFGSLIRNVYLRNKTFYVITDKKIIIKRGNKINMYYGSDLPPMSIKFHKNGNGTLIFREEMYYYRGRRINYFTLDNISDIAGAQNAVNMMKK